MRFSSLFAAASALVSVQATSSGFNYGSTFTTGAAKQAADFKAEFSRAQSLAGTDGEFTSARLYTMIQAGTQNTPISAIQAAIDTKTTLLLGLWASAGQAAIDNEVAALTAAIQQYGTAFTDLIAGISVGSEDLYRITPTGISNHENPGAGPDVLVNYINQVRKAIANTAASKASVGHVDTWTAWVNGSNNAVIEACDFLGMDAYPYFQTTIDNSIEVGKQTFFEAYDATKAVSMGKEVWITETGWPVSGPKAGQAVASVENAETYWKEVACALVGNTNTWWFTLQDAAPDTPSPSFGIVGSDLSSAPKYDLSCGASKPSTSSMASSSTKSAESTKVSSVVDPTQYPTSVKPTEYPTTESTGPSSIVDTIRPTKETTPVAYPTTCPTMVTETVTVTAGQCPPEGCDHQTATPTASTMETKVTPPATSSSASPMTSMTSMTSMASTKTSAVATSSESTGKTCPTNLSGEYQYPHLIVPVSSEQPSKAYGTQYNGTVSSSEHTIFNFDIPASYAGKTCSLVFLFPEKKDLETTDYTFNGQGGLTVEKCAAPATEQTTWANKPAGAGAAGSVSSLAAGNGYVITTGDCPAGERVSYEFSATGGLDLEWFNDWNPSPLGCFITTC